MSRIRHIVITDDAGGKVTLTPQDNVPVEVVDSNGLNLDLTTNKSIPVELINENGTPVDIQHPIQTDGDSIYCKDVYIEGSIVTDWVDTDATGEDIACIPFTSLNTRITNSTTDNPKILIIRMNRSVFFARLGLGCEGGGNFSNVRLIAIGSGGTERIIFDDSANNTKYTSKFYNFTNQVFNAIKIEFYTVDPVCLSNINVQKITSVSVNQVEKTTNSLQVMQYSHSELHAGDRYTYKGFHTILKAGVKEHLIITPDTARWAHFTAGVDAVTSTVTVEFFEDTITSADGTLGQSKNRNRNFPDNNTTIMYEDPTVTTAGSLLSSYVLGSGKRSEGGSNRDSEEILLKQNTKYLFRVTEANVQTTIVNFAFDWYEHTNIEG